MVNSKQIKVDSRDKGGMTPLMIAVDNEFSIEAIQTLIDSGCDVNAQNSDGMTSLHMSACL